jgi:hypothetical protein
MVPAFILCAGDAERIEKAHKQLLQVEEGETILGRIIRQVESREGTPVIVSHNWDILNCFPDAQRIVPSARRWTCETLQSILGYASEDYNIILLGDVIYSKTTMDRIFEARSPTAVFGNEWEIYAITFQRGGVPFLQEAIRKAIEWEGEGKGKLRRVWQALYGLPQGTTYDKELLRHIGSEDYTQDIDTWTEYKTWRNKGHIRLDERRPQ